MSKSEGTPTVISNNTATQLALFDAKEIIRPDVNVGKWAGWIFSSPWAKNLYDSKEFKWTTQYSDEDVDASILIRPINGQKRPTTTSYRAYLAIIQVWEESGRPENGEVFFSARQMAHLMNLNWCGKSTANSLHEQLDILSNTAISWVFSFAKKEGVEKKYSNMHLLEGNEYFERKLFLKKELFTRQQKVTLNRDLVKNMIEGKTKPINYKAFISIKNDSCANLYSLLDIFLAQRKKWERKAYALLKEDLEFSGARYEKRNIRHAKLKEFVKELDGKELSTGKLSLSIALTADKTDYKLVARKISRAEQKNFRKPPKSANSKEDISEIVLEIIEGLSRVGTIDPQKHTDILKVLGYWYSRDILLRALATVMIDFKGNIKTSPIRAYLYLVHKIAHEHKLEWIKDCGKFCKCRPENQQNFFPSQPEKNQDEDENKAPKNLEPQSKKPKEKTKKEVEKELDEKRGELEKSFRIQAVNNFIDTLSDERKEEIFSTLKDENFQVLRQAESIEDFKVRGFLVPFIPNFKRDKKAYVQEKLEEFTANK